MTKMTGAKALVEALLHEGVELMFGYPGGCIMPFYDSLYDYQDTLKHVLVRHEQAAAHAAEGYARMTGKPGVCVATSGPGATNLVTGIADALLDSIPLVCITGQVPSTALGTDAFQETDVIGVTIPITKWSYQITKASEIPWVVSKAFRIAQEGRPGPVLIDITKDAQFEEFDFTPVSHLLPTHSEIKSKYTENGLKRAAELLNKAKTPYILAGHGVLISDATDVLKEFVEKSGIPIGLTLHGLSSFPTGHPLCVGMLGMHGNYGPNKLTNDADVILAVGMRFDDRVTGNISKYAPNAKIIHIEIDPSEIGKTFKTEVGLNGDAKDILEKLLPLVDKREHTKWLARFAKCDRLEHEKVISKAVTPGSDELRMSEVVHRLSELSNGEAVVVADVGQHQMMAARYYKFQKPDSWVTSGGLGTMGFALPAAMGVKMGAPEREVVVVVGDGGFQMTLQELATIKDHNLAIKTVILNNSYLGMVRQWQELFFDNRYASTEISSPDFVKLGEAFGIASKRIVVRGELDGALQEMLATEGPYLLEVVVENEQNVFPMVPSGCGVAEVRLE